MIDLHELLSFAVAAFLIVLIPGPNMTFLISCAVSKGKKAALFALLGSNAALITLGLVTGLGLSTVLKAVPMIYDVLKVAGAFYLFWLGWKNFFIKKSNDNKEIVDKKQISTTGAFRAGFLTNVLNPKSAAFYVAILPAFLNTHIGYLALQGVMFGCIHAVVSFMVNGCILISVRQITKRYQFGARMAAIKKWSSAIIFTAFGVRMLMQKNVY